MAKPTIPEASATVYAALEPFSAEERTNIVTAALAMLGEAPLAVHASAPLSTRRTLERQTTTTEPRPQAGAGLPTKAQRWLSKHSITQDVLDHVFHVDGEDVEVVGDVPGRSDREKTANCYLLTGIAALLSTGEPVFQDADARGLCEHQGCYDTNNHSKYIKLGNRMAGDKKKGWKLLVPGLAEAARLALEMHSPESAG